MKKYKETDLLTLVQARDVIGLERGDSAWYKMRKTLIADYGASNQFGAYKIKYANLQRFISDHFESAPATNG
jgi:hypothetical protein